MWWPGWQPMQSLHTAIRLVPSPDAALQGCVLQTLPSQAGAIGPVSSHPHGKKGQPLSLLRAGSSLERGCFCSVSSVPGLVASVWPLVALSPQPLLVLNPDPIPKLCRSFQPCSRLLPTFRSPYQTLS